MHAQLSVWQAAVFGPLLRSKSRTILSVLVIALGVALGFAIYLINRSAADEISRAARGLFGLADFAIEGGTAGFDENLYPIVARIDGIDAASPVVEIDAKLAERRGSLKVIGLDAFRSKELQPSIANLAPDMMRSDRAMSTRSLFVSASAARELNLRVDDTLDLQIGMGRETFEIAGILPQAALGEHAAVLDIATAQWKFARLGKLSRINLRLAAGADHEDVRRRLRSVLPDSVRIVTPGDSTDDALRLSRAYRSNLTALALVALFTGGFLVYSTQTLAVLRRRRELALLHALGVTRREQFAHTLVEASIVGLLGALLGVMLGFVTARYALEFAGADLGAGYFRGVMPQLRLETLEVVTFVALGMAAAIVGALRPALQAAQTSTASALKSGDAAHGAIQGHGLIALLIAAVGVALSFVPAIDGLPLAGYAAIALFVLATIVAVPSLLQRLLAPVPTLEAVPADLAISHLRGSGRYATLSVSAIVVSFSLMVAMVIMVTSFRSSLDAWTQKLLPADLYVRVGAGEQSAFLDRAQLASLAAIPGIERIAAGRVQQIVFGPEAVPLTLVARDFDPATVEDQIWVTARAASPITGGIPVWISEAAADRFELAPGAQIQLPLGDGMQAAVVAGIWRDYEHQDGAVLLDRATYIALTGDAKATGVSFWLQPDVPVESAQARIRATLGEHVQYDMRTPRELRELSLKVFDRTFAVTYVLEIVAIIIGLFGISASISAQVLARRNEFGVLRHLGMTRAQIAKMLASEGFVLGVLGVLVGLATGAVVSMILIYVVNRQSFHWSMDVYVPSIALSICSVILIAASAAIAVFSGRSAMGSDVVLAVKEDW